MNSLVFPNLFRPKIIHTTYSTFINKVDSGLVRQIKIDGNKIFFTTPKDTLHIKDESKDLVFQTGKMDDANLIDRLLMAESPNKNGKIEFSETIPRENSPVLNFLLYWVLPGVIFFFLWKNVMKSMRGRMGGNYMSFGENKEKIYAEDEIKTTFADVAGQDEAIDLDLIARATSGASGAELANIVNEAALRAVRNNCDSITTSDLEESIETVIAGAQRKGKVISDKEKRIIAYHEIGHALVAAMQTHSAPVHKITIIPRISGALGYTMQIDESERNLYSKEDLQNRITTFTGGRAAEEVIFNTITTGASNDIEQATKIARAMVTRFGMSEEFGMVALETVNNPYLSGDTSLSCSPKTAAEIDDVVLKIVKKAYEKAKQIIRDNEAKMHELSEYLLEKETITGEEFMNILEGKSE